MRTLVCCTLDYAKSKHFPETPRLALDIGSAPRASESATLEQKPLAIDAPGSKQANRTKPRRGACHSPSQQEDRGQARGAERAQQQRFGQADDKS